MARLVFLSCHLTGTGHLVRSLALARAALRRGHDVTVINGGRQIDHVDTTGLDIVQLPPLTVRGFEFTTLRQPDGQLADADYMARRQSAIDTALPGADALITELFPFGRRAMRSEFLSATDTARRAGAAIICSVRDVPEPKPKRLSEVADRLRTHYDAVLVHGDASFLPLSATWPLPDDVTPMIHHTGYVGSGVLLDDSTPGDEVLVSVGGGVLGRDVLVIAAKAAATSPRPWRILVGGADAGAVSASLSARFPAPNLTIEPARADYLDILSRAACSISLCGYNTAVELSMRMTPAILIPSEEAGEQEQLIRARHLASSRGMTLIRMTDLTADRLAQVTETLARGPRRRPHPLKGDDGTAAIDVVETILAENYS